MEKRIILPMTRFESLDSPLIFLAGPIRNAQDWQEKAIDYILTKNNQVIIANPRWNASKKIRNRAIDGNGECFSRQRAWERHYLELAYENGAVMFWLENAPGYMTRLELGQAMTRYKFKKPTNFCVGGEKQFSDIKTIAYDLLEDTGKTIYSTLQETCDAAIKLANKER